MTIGDTFAAVLAQPAVAVAARLALVCLVVLWIASAWWVWQDARARARGTIVAYVSAAAVIIVTPLLFPLAVVSPTACSGRTGRSRSSASQTSTSRSSRRSLPSHGARSARLPWRTHGSSALCASRRSGPAVAHAGGRSRMTGGSAPGVPPRSPGKHRRKGVPVSRPRPSPSRCTPAAGRSCPRSLRRTRRQRHDATRHGDRDPDPTLLTTRTWERRTIREGTGSCGVRPAVGPVTGSSAACKADRLRIAFPDVLSVSLRTPSG